MGYLFALFALMLISVFSSEIVEWIDGKVNGDIRRESKEKEEQIRIEKFNHMMSITNLKEGN